MQSSGVGNCVNMLSLPMLHRTPLPMIVTMRGDFGEFNPAQVPMGNATQPVLEAMGTLVRRADHAGGRGADGGRDAAHGVQHVPPDRDADRPARAGRQDVREGLRRWRARHDSTGASWCRAVLADRGGMLVIAGLGAPAWDITAAGDARRTCRSGAAWAGRR